MRLETPWGDARISEFLETYFYGPECVALRTVTRADAEAGVMEAVVPPGVKHLVAPYQRGEESWHPRHVSGADLLMATVAMGSLHAYFFHGCEWKKGWVGFGNRIREAQFHKLASLDRDLMLRSTEKRTRKGAERLFMEMEFEFSQGGEPVYTSQQTAMFVLKPREG